jgi:hypothetical protein
MQVILNNIRLETIGYVGITELKRCCLCMLLITLKLATIVIEVVITLLLNGRLVHDHTSSYHLMHDLNITCSSKMMNNSPPSLEHTKFPFHIFPPSLLPLGKPFHFLNWRITNCL